MEFTFDLQLFADVALTLDGVAVTDGKFTVVPDAGTYTYTIVDEGAGIKVELTEGLVELGTFSLTDDENGYVSFLANEALGGVLESSESTITIADGDELYLRQADFSAVKSNSFSVIAGAETTVVFDDKTYTAKAANTKFTAVYTENDLAVEEFNITLASGTVELSGAIKVDGNTYSSTGDPVTLRVDENLAVTLEDGDVCLGKGAAVTANGNVITNVRTEPLDESFIDDGTVTVNKDGNITELWTTAKIAISENGSVTVGSTVYTNVGEGAATIYTGNEFEASLVSGTISVAGSVNIFSHGGQILNSDGELVVDDTLGVTKAEVGCQIYSGYKKGSLVIVNGVTYKNAEEDAPDFGTGSSISLDNTLAATLDTGAFTFGGEGAAITAGTYIVTCNTADEITVHNAGVISNLSAGADFTVKDDETLTTYTVGAAVDGKVDIVVSGDYIGVYNDVTLAGTTITPQDGPDAIATNEEPVAAAAVQFAYEAGKDFYALVNTNGALTAVACDTADGAKGTAGAIGYFEFSGADGVETVTLRNKAGDARSLIGDVTINTADLTQAGATAVTKIIVKDVVSGENGVTLTNVADTVTVVDGTEHWAGIPASYDLSAIKNKFSGTTPQYLVDGVWTEEKPADVSKLSAMLDENRVLFVSTRHKGIVSIDGVGAGEIQSIGIALCSGFSKSGEGEITGKVNVNDKASVVFGDGEGDYGDSVLKDLTLSEAVLSGKVLMRFDPDAYGRFTLLPGAVLNAVSPADGDIKHLTVTEESVVATYHGWDMVLSGFVDGTKAVISDENGKEAFSVTASDGKADFAFTGSWGVGHFVGVDAATARFPISGNGYLTISDKNGSVDSVELPKLQLGAMTDTGAGGPLTDYYAVYWDSTDKNYYYEPLAEPPTEAENLIGYFKLVVMRHSKTGQLTAQLRFCNREGHEAELLGKLPIDVANLQVVDSEGQSVGLWRLDVPSGALLIYNLPTTTRITGLGTDDEVRIEEPISGTINVNGTALTAVNSPVTVLGDGRAVTGTFSIGDILYAAGDGFTVQITGAPTAVVTLSNGVVTGLTGLTANNTVTVTKTDGHGTVSTTSYMAETSGDKLKITRIFTDDVVTTKTTADGVASDVNILEASYVDSAPFAIDLSAIRDKLSGTTSYYLVDGKWTSEKPTDASKVTAVFDAEYRALTFKAGHADTVSIEGVNASELMGTSERNSSAGISFVEGFYMEGGQVVGTAARNARVNVVFGDESLRHLKFSNVVMAGDNISFDPGVLCKVRIPAGATLTAVSPTAEIGDTETLTVHEGRVSVTYEGRGHDFVVGDFNNGEDGRTRISSSDDDEQNMMTVTVKDGKADGTVTGSVAGHFRFDAASGAFTIPAQGWRGLSDKDGAVDSVDVDLPSTNFGTRKNYDDNLGLSSITDYFTVSWDEENGKYVLWGASDAPYGEFGYFKLVVNDNGGQPTAKLTFHDAAGNHSELLGNVYIDVKGLCDIKLADGTFAPLAKLDVTDVASNLDTLFVYNLPTTTEIEGLGRREVQVLSHITRQDFQWNGVGYFEGLALDPSKRNVYNFDWSSEEATEESPYPAYAEPIEPQNWHNWIGGDDAGKVYLEVTAAQDVSGIATIESMRLVEMQEDGSFAEHAGVVGNVEIEAAGLNGLKLPTHTANVRIWAKQPGVFTGLNANDVVEVSGPWTDENGIYYPGNPFDGTLTVNGKKFTVKKERGVVIYGDGTLGRGDFLITGTATAAAVPWDGTDLYKTLTYTSASGTGDGVCVSVHSDGDGGIGQVTGLDAGENVVITSTKGNKEDIRAVKDKGDVLVTRLITHDGLNVRFTRRGDADTIRKTAVTHALGYTVENLFDYGATEDGKVGFFRADKTNPDNPVLTVAQQQESDKVTLEQRNLYLAVGAAKDAKTCTITHLELLVLFDHGDQSDLDDMPFFEVDKAKYKAEYPKLVFPDIPLPPIRDVEFVAPEGVDLTLAANAIKLNPITVNDGNDNPAKIQNGPRVVAIHVTGAAAGRKYIGFSALDTVSMTGTAAAGTTVTVGETAKTAKTYKTAGAGALSIRGDGKAIDGVFAIGKALETAGDGFTSKITGAAAAVATLSGGHVASLTGLTAKQTVVITQTSSFGAVTTATYKTEASKDYAGKLKITRTVVADGVTTTATADNVTGDVIGASYTETVSSTVNSVFDWTMKNGSGFFAATVELDSDRKVRNIGTVDVQPTTTKITDKDKDKYFVRVALSADGAIDPAEGKGVTLYQVQENGALQAVALEAATAGTLNITAPQDMPLVFDKSKSALDGVRVNITGVVNGSVIDGLKDGDTVSTSKLTDGDVITINGVEYTAGSSDYLELGFFRDKEDVTKTVAKVSDGTLVFAEDTTKPVLTTNGQFVVETNGDRAVVKVVGGEVVGTSGLTFDDEGHPKGSVTVKDANGSDVVLYNVAAANYSWPLENGTRVKTIVLEKYQGVQVGGKAYHVGATGTVTFDVLVEDEQTKARFVDGVLMFNHFEGDETEREIVLKDGTSVRFAESPRHNQICVTVRNGEVASITGMTFNDVVVVGDTTYKATSNAVVKQWKTAEGESTAVTAYLASANGDVIGAKYLVKDTEKDISKDENAYEGQFNWLGIDGRCLGYFEVDAAKKTVTIADQNKRARVGAKQGTPSVWLAASSVQPNNSYLRVLSFGALKAENDGSKTYVSGVSKKKLLQDVTIKVAAPAGQAIKFTKENADKTGEYKPFHIILSKVAYGSRIVDLEDGDSFTSDTLEQYQRIFLADGGRNEEKLINNTYVAAAKCTMEFQGEGKRSDGSNRTTLLNGTILLRATRDNKKYITPNTALIAGSKGNNKADDVKVTAGGSVNDYLTVTVRNGKIKGITGLQTVGATLTVGAVKYTVLHSELAGVNAKTGVKTYNTMIERTEGEVKTYVASTNLKNIFADTSTANGYKKPGDNIPTNIEKLWTKSATVYIAAQYNASTGKYFGTLKQMDSLEIDVSDAEKIRGQYFLGVTTSTMKGGVISIDRAAVMRINAIGLMEPVKNAKVGRINIDGTIGVNSYAKIRYAIPKGSAVTAVNVALGSDFSGIQHGEGGDMITTAPDGTFILGKDGNKLNVYKAGSYRTEVTTYTCKKTGEVTATMTDGALSITGFKKGSLTVVSTTEAEGRIQTDYVWTGEKLEKTVTLANGEKKKYEAANAGTAKTLDDLTFGDPTAFVQVVSDFDWTMGKNKTGYFAVSGTGKAAAAAAKTQTTKISNNQKNYIAVTLSADGTVGHIGQQVFDGNTKTGGMKDATGEKFSGTLTIAAPTTTALTFDRKTLDENAFADSAHVAVTGAAADSRITNLVDDDTVTTAKLAAGQSVTVGLGSDETPRKFTVGAAGKLSFQAVAPGDDDLPKELLMLTGGTISLTANGSSSPGGNYAYLYQKRIMAMKGTLTVTTKVTITKDNSGHRAYAMTYNVGGLGEGDSFTIHDYEDGAERTFMKSATALFCETEGSTYVYTKKAGGSVAGAVLDDPTGWALCDDKTLAFREGKLVSGNAVTADLTTLDKRLAADKAVAGGEADTYGFVIDKYMAAPQKFTGAASIITKDAYVSVQQLVGMIGDNYVYTASANISQTVKTANGWTVKGSSLADVLVGAAKGGDTLIGGLGDDTLTGGGANDVFVFGQAEGKDVVKSYTVGKDKIIVAKDSGDWWVDEDQEDEEAVAEAKAEKYTDLALDKHFRLVATKSGKSTTADAMIYDGSEAAENSILLTGMGNGKAVTINDKTYFFGSAVVTKGVTKSMTFTYVEGAHYLGSENAPKNTLSVGTDATKAGANALGDAVKVDLSDTAHYMNIGAVDASKSANALILTASTNGSTLKGGTYRSILKGGVGQDSLVGGSGADVFWFDSVAKDDVVSGYTSGKDSVYLGGRLPIADGMTVEAKGTDVIISNGEAGSVTLQKAANAAKAVTVLADEDGKENLSYYVGANKAKAKNSFTAIIDTDTVTDEENNTAFRSYYIGSGDSTAVDTLTVKTAKDAEARVMKATFSLQSDAHLSAIDAIDASGISAASGSTITYEGAAKGTFKLIGSKSTNVKETFNLEALEIGANAVTVTNLTLGDVIELAAGVTLTEKSKRNAGTAVYSMTDSAGKDLGNLTITGVKAESLTITTDKTGVNKTTVKL